MNKIILSIILICSFSYSGEANSMDQRQKFERFFVNLNSDTMHLVDEFYHEQAKFEDPVGKLEGREKIKSYLVALYKNAKSVRFEFTNFVSEGNRHVGFWKMYVAVPMLNGGKEYEVTGNSLIEFDSKSDKVVYHRDYFDMGAFVYEQIPILKSIIVLLRKQIANH